jgi:hypothetical protein
MSALVIVFNDPRTPLQDVMCSCPLDERRQLPPLPLITEAIPATRQDALAALGSCFGSVRPRRHPARSAFV